MSTLPRTIFTYFSTFSVVMGMVLGMVGVVDAETVGFSTPGSSTWIAPAGVTSITVEAWGAGGAGGGSRKYPSEGGGGAGGQYAKKLVTVVPGSSYSVVVGAGGSGGTGNGAAGGDSNFGGGVVVARGGAGGKVGNDGTGAAGAGSDKNGVGDVVYAGGSGSAGAVPLVGVFWAQYVCSGGAGGGGAGSGGDGGSASGNSGGIGTASGGGAGAAGVSSTGDGSDGDSAGGGGSAACATNSYYGNPSYSGGAGAAGLVKISYSVKLDCVPPDNVKATGVAVTCYCDTFDRSAINPSPIFDGSWALSNSDGISDPSIVSDRLQLTKNTPKNAKAATAPGFFPAAGNYISIEFNHYAYAGTSTGADGMAVTLSDYSIPAVPGAFGGSLGYAQKSNTLSDCTTSGGCPGFAGGWLGVGLDEYGYYTAAAEGRVGGDKATAQSQSIGVRGPGRAQNGYRWMGGAIGVEGGISASGATPAPGAMYQVIVDSRNSATGTIDVQVNRDSTNKNGSSYSTLFGPFNAYTEARYAVNQGWISKVIPDYWKISFTGSTGSYTNFHEVDNLRICAQYAYASTSGIASGFSAIDEAHSMTTVPPAYQAFQTGDIFMKLAATPFKLWVAALTTTPASGLAVNYALSSDKFVQVKLVDNSDNVCGSDGKRTCNSDCTGKSAVETGASQTVTFPRGNATGAVLSSSFTLNSAYQNLIAVIKECTSSDCSSFSSTAAACSADTFSVRPSNFVSVTSTNAGNAANSGTPMLKAGGDTFALTATTVAGYTAVPQINRAAVKAYAPATQAGVLSGDFPAATSGASSSATGTAFKYSEVGAFYFRGPDFSLATQGRPGVYDETWTAVDSGADGDCVSGTGAAAYSISKNSDGKYGCYFGIAGDTAGFGRFIPDHFNTVVVQSAGVPMPCPTGLTCPALYNGYAYAGQPFAVNVYAKNASDETTQNYDGTMGLSRLVTLSAWNALGGSVANITLNNATIQASAFTKGTTESAPATPNFTFTKMPGVPADIYLRASEAANNDGTTSLRGASSVEGGVKIVSGRVRLPNAYGSELLPLPVAATVQYYDATGTWITSTTDSLTQMTLAASYALTKNGVLTACATTPSPVSLVATSGALSFVLGKPGCGSGSAKIVPTVPSYLPLVPGLATFGVYKTPLIYRREVY